MIKKVLVVFLFFILIFSCGYKKPYRYVIDAEKDAYYHNNIGLNYLKDRVYYAAIQEFKIAISLSPSSQASAIFYNNLGETYIFIGYPDLALPCFEDAVKLYGLNLKYHLNLVNCYVKLGQAEARKKQFRTSSDTYDKIKLGLLLIETGEYRSGVNVLDEVCATEPDLLITSALKQYISQIIKDKL